MATTLTVTNVKVNNKYWPSRGTTNEVGGMISMRHRRKTSTDRTMEMVSETWKRVGRNYSVIVIVAVVVVVLIWLQVWV